MQWRKLGLLFRPDGERPWMRSHASNPVAEPLGGDLFRIYFSSRDDMNRSSIGWVELDLRRPEKLLRVAERPVVAPGAAGSFDDSGASMGSLLVRPDGARFLYYVGWNLGVTVPWRNSIGLAVSERAGAPFEKFSRAPLIDRSDADPYSLSYPWVLAEGGSWTMWYGSNLSWGPTQEDMAHVVKRADSADGLSWRRDGTVAIALRPGGEVAVSRPCVLRDKDRYRMWYSYRGRSYRLGYAESADGLRWQRMDEAIGLAPSPSGWDSESVSYAQVFDHAGQRYMLYNGNGYGRTGFGLAVREAA
jgi:hypothetical protein